MDAVDKMLCTINVSYLHPAAREDIVEMLNSGVILNGQQYFAVSLFQDVPVSIWREYLLNRDKTIDQKRLDAAIHLSRDCNVSRLSKSVIYLEQQKGTIAMSQKHTVSKHINDRPWKTLLREALEIIHANPILEGHWTLGGGTVLAFSMQHRESHDIDIFLDDPQLLSYVSPKFYDNVSDTTYTEMSNFIKWYREDGEIDFILAPRLLPELPLQTLHFEGYHIPCEHPLEIVAKKLHYRSNSFTLRDWFDLAVVVERYGTNVLQAFIVPNLSHLGRVPDPNDFLELRLSPHCSNEKKLKDIIDVLSEKITAMRDERARELQMLADESIEEFNNLDEPCL